MDNVDRREYLCRIKRIAADVIAAADRQRAESLAARTGIDERIIMEATRIVRREMDGAASEGQRRHLAAANDA